MPKPLADRRILAITTNYGVEQDELMVPATQLGEAGADVDVAAILDEPIHTLVHDQNRGVTVAPSTTMANVSTADYDLLMIPGGTINADSLRLNGDAVDIVRDFTATRRPVAAICHGPWLLAEAGVVSGRSVTSYPSLRTDLVNAGATWSDAPVVRDTEGPLLITSRMPMDLHGFVAAITQALTN